MAQRIITGTIVRRWEPSDLRWFETRAVIIAVKVDGSASDAYPQGETIVLSGNPLKIPNLAVVEKKDRIQARISANGNLRDIWGDQPLEG